MSRPEYSADQTLAKKRRRLWRWLLEALVFLLLLYLIHLWQTRNAVEGVAPSLEGPLLGGGHYSLEPPSGKPRLVYVWADWCPVCKLTSGSVDELAEEHEVITLAMQSGDAASLQRYLGDKGLDFPVIADPDGRIARSWGVQGVPTLFFLDRENRIESVSVGYTSKPGMRFRLWMAR